MYLFLGQDRAVSSDDVIGIFDLDNTSLSRVTKEYLFKAEKAGRVITIAQDIPKSFIVCGSGGRDGDFRIYLSQVSPATLRKRSASVPPEPPALRRL